MPALLTCAMLDGLKGLPIEVEVDVLPGLPKFTIVGLGDTAVKESKDRLTAALSNLNFTPPRKKTIVSLAPASKKKEGSQYDLAITIGFLLASKQISIPGTSLNNAWFIGEVGLDGSIKPVQGVLPISIAAYQAGSSALYIPSGNSAEATALASDIPIYPVKSLMQIVNHLSNPNGPHAIPALQAKPQIEEEDIDPEIDFSDIRGQEHAKRALAIAASAGHNVLMVGPPGSGKTLLARALAGILPPLTREEGLAVTSLYSIAGLLPSGAGLISRRPFRSPHHGASSVALIGGGPNPKPGEVSLAHEGVLFLDELPEFSSHVLDQLRQPIESGYVTIARASSTITYPARSVLVGAMNPCKCGYIGSQHKECVCSPSDVLRYQRRVSGPLLDRFDIHVMVNDIPMEELLSDSPGGVPSRDIARQTSSARSTQLKRQGKPNSQLTAREIRQYCHIDGLSEKLLKQAEGKFHLSSRGIHRLLKVSRTIADLSGEESIRPEHLAEALQYRQQLQSALPEFI